MITWFILWKELIARCNLPVVSDKAFNKLVLLVFSRTCNWLILV